MDVNNKKLKEEFKQRLYGWVLRLIKFIDKLPKDQVSYVMGKQLIRSGTSILANYVEAKSASSKKDFINFFNYSLKSANESGVRLELLRDLDKGDRSENNFLLIELFEISRILASSILTMKRKK